MERGYVYLYPDDSLAHTSDHVFLFYSTMYVARY
jgi:hypothetical protein